MATHIAPDALARCDLTTLLTLAEEVREEHEAKQWTTLHELLAGIVDLLGVMRVENLARGGVKPWRLPEPRRVPRPGEKRPEQVAFTAREFALMSVGVR